MNFYIAQGISILTAVTGIVTMQFKNIKMILAGQLLANLLTALTYALLDGFSGACICIIAIIQTTVMYIYNYRKLNPPFLLIIGFIMLYIGCSAYYFSSFIDIFSALASICYAISVSRKKASATRFWYSLNPLFWMVYDIYFKAYANFIMHLIIFISTVWAMLRIDNILKLKTSK